jgi:hypothetical protein
MHSNGSEITDDTTVNILFADNKVLLSDLEDDLQRALCTLHNITKQPGVEISTLKSKVLSFKGQVPISNETVTDDSALQQVNTFMYLGCKISCKEEEGVT